MEWLLNACKVLFDESPQAIGIARVLVDDAGKPYDFSYEYLNPVMAAFTDETVDDLMGIHAYEQWGDDDISWLNHFSEAAFEGIACEFETVAIIIEKFLHATVTPLIEGYCSFSIQDVTTLVDQDLYKDDDLAVGFFFLDFRTYNIMLTSATRERYGFKKGYIPVTVFAELLYGPQGAQEIKAQIEKMHNEHQDILFESRSLDGRWLRISASNIAQSERFVFCLIEDITRAREAEERSAHQMRVIEGVARENFALYVIDTDNNEIEVYSQSEDIVGKGFIQSIVDENCVEARNEYLDHVVSAEDRELVDKMMNRDTLMSFFASGEDAMTFTYRRLIDGEEQYVEARIICLEGTERTAVLAIRNTHEEIQEQLRQKHALQRALELAQHASSAKSTFLTNMSHDFRTPMNSIIGFTGIALEHADDNEVMVDCLEKIKKSSSHLLSLINDVLDVSRIESGIIETSEEEVDLLSFAEDMNSLFSGEAMRKSISFNVDTRNLRRRCVLADRQHLGQIMVNLIGNAFKFTEAGGSVTVRLEEFDEQQEIYGAHVPEGYGRYDFIVSDTGCGMVPEFLEKLFVPFERDGLGHPNLTEGTGLGMPITKNLVELFGGSIEVKSKVGQGSEFTVSLPLKLASSASGSDVSSECGARSDEKREAEESATAHALAAKASDDEKQRKDDAKANSSKKDRFKGKRVLVVDDDDLSREIVQTILTSVGFEVEEANDGEVAVRMILEAEPRWYDGVLMDMRMAHMSGDEATKIIRSSEREDLQHLPIFALTADAFEEGRRRSREVGMVAHITKPFKRAELLDLLETYIF